MLYRKVTYSEQIWYLLRFKAREVFKMPRKPKHPCHHPGCPNLTENRFCEEHTKQHNRDYELYGRNPDTRRRYGRAWHRIRTKYVQEHPFCEICYKEGKLVPTEQVHHIKPLAEGGTHDRDNLIALCKSCHARIHAERGDRWHNAGRSGYEKSDADDNAHGSANADRL